MSTNKAAFNVLYLSLSVQGVIDWKDSSLKRCITRVHWNVKPYSLLASWPQGLKSNFKVVGMAKIPSPPVKICGPLSILQRAPVFLVRPLLWPKFRLTSSLENLRSHGQKLSFRPVNVRSDGKALFWGLGMPDCRNGGLGMAFPPTFTSAWTPPYKVQTGLLFFGTYSQTLDNFGLRSWHYEWLIQEFCLGESNAINVKYMSDYINHKYNKCNMYK